MGLDNLIKEIALSTSDEEKRIREDAKREAAEIIADAKREAQKILGEALKQAEEAVGREKYAIAAAELAANKAVSDAKQQLVEQSLKEARENAFEDVPKSTRYPALFGALAGEAVAAAGIGAKIHCNKKDFALAKKLRLDPLQADCSGGVIAVSADGKLRANNSLEALFEEREEELRVRAAELLFGEKKKAKK